MKCLVCGTEFKTNGRKKYCSLKCAGIAFRRQQAKRQRKILEASKV